MRFDWRSLVRTEYEKNILNRKRTDWSVSELERVVWCEWE